MIRLMKSFLFFSLAVLCFNSNSLASSEWTEGKPIPPNGRPNILNLSNEEQSQYVHAGQLHAQFYPVTVTGALPPYRPVKSFLEERSSNPLKELFRKMGRLFSGYKNFDDILKGLGLHPYPAATDTGLYQVSWPQEGRPHHRMGVGFIERQGATGFTFSCATCHSSNLFGKTVLGMTNRFPRANEFFVQAKSLTPYLNPWLFKVSTGASDEEVRLLTSTLYNLDRVEVKRPIVLGLDTSLAQVALSLNKRKLDPWATPDLKIQKHPRRDPFLDDNPADSKPAVWWNLKYKNRWLSDGSVLSGNPIVTNILWNEIGRGTDLQLLDLWIMNNMKTIDEITAAVFATEAPRITDFFPEEKIQLDRAKRGEILFKQNCAKCHGHYDKAWSLPESSQWPLKDQIQTVQVRYKENTPVVDVGTDPYRRLGMKSLEELNRLEISKRYGVKVQAQPGYVPPPLVGIWARWPYFHNNSIPNLCALLTPSAKRPRYYFAGAANDPSKDFDFECNGYPLGAKTPDNWKKSILLYDTRKKGMSNSGHDERIFIKDGKEIFSTQDKKDLIHFLQTL